MSKWILIAILLFGFFLRIINLGTYPTGFTPDEASFGYDAYSLLKTGNDQWGNRFPLVLKSFGDYKAPLYAYLTIPSVAIFGLTKEAVRLPNVIIGSLAILATYLLATKISQNKKIGLISAFILAISSWHIMMSRGAFEANLTTFFLPFGLYFLLSKKYWQGAIILGLNLFTYHSAKIVTPVVIIFFIFLFYKTIFKIQKIKLVIAGSLFALFLLVTGYTLFNGAATRALDVSIFGGSLEAAFDERQNAVSQGENATIAKLLHNKYTIDLQRFAGNWVSYFSPSFLFIHGPAEYTYGMLPGLGVLYLFELPLLILFFVNFARVKEKKSHFLILGWILVAPIPAALATGPGYAANRSVIMVPAIQIALGIGGFELLNLIKNRYVKIIFGFFAFLCFLTFIETYFSTSPARAAKGMLYGNLEVVYWLKSNTAKDSQIIIDRDLSEPHIYVAFANAWDPIDYQHQSQSWQLEKLGLKWVDQIPDYKLGNYEFKTVHTQEYTNSHNIYLVSRSEVFSGKAGIQKIFYYPNKTIDLAIYLQR